MASRHDFHVVPPCLSGGTEAIVQYAGHRAVRQAKKLFPREVVSKRPLCKADTWPNYLEELGRDRELETVSRVTEPCFWYGNV